MGMIKRRFCLAALVATLTLVPAMTVLAYSVANLEGSWTVTGSGDAAWTVIIDRQGKVTEFTTNRESVVAFTGQFLVSADGSAQGTMTREMVERGPVGSHLWAEDTFSGGFTSATTMSLHQSLAWWDQTGSRNYATYETTWKKKEPAGDYTNSIGMKLKLIPAGSYYKGNNLDNLVTIPQPFYMGIYEVTQAQWKALMGFEWDCYFKGDDRPVEMVSWEDAQVFIASLNAQENTDKYRLPSDDEWEYACRAGTSTAWSFGDDESQLKDYAWYLDNSDKQSHPVGLKKPNLWGLYDMHGNLHEWVDGEVDYFGVLKRQARGGAWNFYPAWMSSYSRSIYRSGRGNFMGFRIVRNQ